MSQTLFIEENIKRSMDIKDIDDQVKYIDDIARELKELVNKQQLNINNIQNYTDKIDNNIDNGNDNLSKSNNKKLWISMASGILLSSVIIGPQIMIPVGLLTASGMVLIKKYSK